MAGIEKTALFLWLRTERPEYAYKALELREVAEAWLSQIPHTFPHYTRHTVDHSDEIILQMSNILFRDSQPTSLALSGLSPTEAYVVIAGAYLHDAGMVASPKQQEAVLRSQEWLDWIGEGTPQHKRLLEAEEIRTKNAASDSHTRTFLADLQIRFVLAEFFRRVHHHRSAELVQLHQRELARFAFDDGRLANAVAAVCAGHGLAHYELDDQYRFPDETDLRGDKVNLRFCAVLLRLGDLLDLRTDRACPLLLNAVCPLPPESIAHWSQYTSIQHVNVAPDRIEIRAACSTPDEHRVLQDWCRWIEDETVHARRQLASARRHGGWSPPQAHIGKAGVRDTTIIIEPAAGARYMDIDWRFELDEQTVFERLTRDVYPSPLAFLRELLQNAIDAVRCRLSLDLRAQGLPVPEDLRLVSEEWRSRYRVVVSRQDLAVRNEHSGEDEQRTVVSVDDPGIGMGRDVVRKYLLQVGRSYYQSLEFRRAYSFHPTSQFGVGFLSVFATSDHVEIDTKSPESQDGPIALKLTGPRNYLLVERGTRQNSGTRVTVRTNHSLAPGQLLELVQHWCKRVEFPVVVEEGGSAVEVRAESPDSFIAVCTDPLDPSTTYKIRQFPFSDRGVTGELYVLATLRDNKERWDFSDYSAKDRSLSTPLGNVPVPPEQLICFNGMTINEAGGHGQERHYRVDCRSAALSPTLSREGLQGRRGSFREGGPLRELLANHWREAISHHLSSVSSECDAEESWRYKQRLADTFRVSGIWTDEPEMVPFRQDGRLSPSSFRAATEKESIWFIAPTRRYHRPEAFDWTEASALSGPCLLSIDSYAFCEAHASLLNGRHLAEIRELSSEWRAARWSIEGETLLPMQAPGTLIASSHAFALPASSEFVVSLRAPKEHYVWIVVNTSNPLAAWCCRMWKRQWTTDDAPLKRQTAERLWKLVTSVFEPGSRRDGARESINTFLDEWNRLPDLPPELRPPSTRLPTD